MTAAAASVAPHRLDPALPAYLSQLGPAADKALRQAAQFDPGALQLADRGGGVDSWLADVEVEAFGGEAGEEWVVGRFWKGHFV